MAIRDNLVGRAGIAVAITVKEFIILALTDAPVALSDLSRGASTSLTIIDKVSRADSTDSIDEEAIVQLTTSSTNSSLIVSESSHACASTSYKLLIDSTVIATFTICGRP